MGFHKSSMDIELKNGHVLTAYCRRPSGEASYSELNLDDFLGAKRGKHSEQRRERQRQPCQNKTSPPLKKV
jgi:hypothetical protein